MARNVFRRIERLEARAVATTRGSLVFRILLVHPVEGLTGVLVLDSDGTTKEPGTPEEKERVRAGMLKRRAAARIPGQQRFEESRALQEER